MSDRPGEDGTDVYPRAVLRRPIAWAAGATRGSYGSAVCVAEPFIRFALSRFARRRVTDRGWVGGANARRAELFRL